MTPPVCAADIVAAGAVWPGPSPVTRPAPAGVAQEPWSAYRLDATTEQSLALPGRIKRMGRGQEMAIAAVKCALDSCAERAAPPARGSGTAVSVGTAWAEEGDEIIFLEHLIKLGEKAAKPAYFVNSVKNALASQLALTYGFQGENQTFAHDALSFESALWQGARLLCAGRARHAVVCGVEALFEFQEIHGHLRGWYGTDPSPLTPLSAHKRAMGQGTLPGEGAAAFVLTAPGVVAAPLARLVGVRARGPLQRAPVLTGKNELAFALQALSDTGTSLDHVSLVLMGANGDPALDAIYAEVAQGLRARAPGLAMGVYRHLTGDFATASALGLELAVGTVAGRSSPNKILVVDGSLGSAGSIRHVLLYHLTSAGYHSVMIVSA
jgi:3-oxoacyl-(acyl-carrier-protein) synthase